MKGTIYISVFVLFFAIIMSTNYSLCEEYVVEDKKENKEVCKDETELECYYNVPLSHELQNHIIQTSSKYNVNPENIFAIAKVESNFKQHVKCSNNIGGNYSVGIMQLNNNYTNWYKEITDIDNFDITNVYHNIEGGIAVYNYYKRYWKNQGYEGRDLVIRSLNSYNMGIAGFEDYIKKTGFVSRSYDRKILDYKEELKCIEVSSIKD